jgi:hypothetical protein
MATERTFIPQRLFKLVCKKEGKYPLFAILTTESNAMIESIRSTAMPVPCNEEHAETWLIAQREIALQLQHPAPELLLRGTL